MIPTQYTSANIYIYNNNELLLLVDPIPARPNNRLHPHPLLLHHNNSRPAQPGPVSPAQEVDTIGVECAGDICAVAAVGHW